MDSKSPTPVALSPSVAVESPSSSGVPSPAIPPVAQAQVDGSGSGSPATDAKKLSNAELKKRAKADKLARRQQQRGGREGAAESLSGAASTPELGAAGRSGRGSFHGTRAPGTPQMHKPKGPVFEAPKSDEKTVAVFEHLGVKRRSTIAGAGKEIHPAVLALGLQLSEYVICGSSARCVAMLLAFKRVIESYVTPPKNSLTRHLTTHLSPQITYLTSCRPLSVSQGNAIRAIKLAISSIDPSVPDNEAKVFLCEYIDQYIRERITVAGQVITNSAADKIRDGDIVLTYGHSHSIQKALLLAHSLGKKFRVVIVDTRPLFEGKSLARTLADAGLDVRYFYITGLHHAMKDVTKVFLGAHAMMSNGQLYARVGTAMVAMAAKERIGGITTPVIVCCETVKFVDRVALDSVVLNEIAPPDELVSFPTTEQVSHLGDASKAAVESKGGKKGRKEEVAVPDGPTPDPYHPLKYWKQKPNLQILNVMYDVTPKEYIDLVITEMGSLPPSAVPIVHRISTNLAALQ
ncbi:hypothetical protein KEM56_001443 [Ascosphaera pollenicola]|nr:hypothetical protein KEM56_001443 [Ascosphaera pollenicola]